jgi:hypothetical protein
MKCYRLSILWSIVNYVDNCRPVEKPVRVGVVHKAQNWVVGQFGPFGLGQLEVKAANVLNERTRNVFRLAVTNRHAC